MGTQEVAIPEVVEARALISALDPDASARESGSGDDCATPSRRSELETPRVSRNWWPRRKPRKRTIGSAWTDSTLQTGRTNQNTGVGERSEVLSEPPGE